LFALLKVLSLFTSELFAVDIRGLIQGSFNLKSLVVFLGGVFLIYTALKEILHMMMLEEQQRERNPVHSSPFYFHIVIMNVIFFFRFYFKCHGSDTKLHLNSDSHTDRWSINGCTCRQSN